MGTTETPAAYIICTDQSIKTFYNQRGYVKRKSRLAKTEKYECVFYIDNIPRKKILDKSQFKTIKSFFKN